MAFLLIVCELPAGCRQQKLATVGRVSNDCFGDLPTSFLDACTNYWSSRVCEFPKSAAVFED
jgi:hypothetical protein